MGTIKELIEKLQPDTETALQVVREMSKDEGPIAKLVIEQKRSEPLTPIRMESAPRAHKFFDVASFGAYLSIYGCNSTVVFGDPNTEKISAVLDERAVDGFEVVACEPMLHPQWQPWEKICGSRHKLSDFVTFLMCNRRAIVGGKELCRELSQINATTTVQLARGRGKNAINGIMFTSKIQGQEASGVVELPDEIVLEIPIYIGSAPRKIALDLLIEVVPSGTDLIAGISSGDLLAIKTEMFLEMMETLKKSASSGVKVCLGSPDYSKWEYLGDNPYTVKPRNP